MVEIDDVAGHRAKANQQRDSRLAAHILLTGAVQGYGASSYGDGLADVYDDWYAGQLVTDEAVEVLAALADGGRVLELGVGTGRLAIPLAERGLDVTGLDASRPMLDRLEVKVGGSLVRAVEADMGAALPGGPYRLVFVAYNTLFNLASADAQQAAFTHVAEVLEPGGVFVVEAFVPTAGSDVTSGVDVRSLAADRVVLSVHRHDPATQRAEGSYVELSPAGGVRLRPWAIRYSTPDQLDEMASRAGFTPVGRHAGWDLGPFTAECDHHVSIYRCAV
jgi:SAM-dependent methyltransferase